MQKVQNEANKSFRISEGSVRSSQDPPLAVTPDGRDGRPYIEFVHVSKSFDDQPVLVDVSFEVRRGEMVAVLGRSGVGKSVTLKHILGFLHPDEGRVFVAGREVSKSSEAELEEIRRKVTMVFQSGALFDSLTVAENVRSEEYTSELQSR